MSVDDRNAPTAWARGYQAGYDQGRIDTACQQSGEASGAKDQPAPSHADSRKAKTDRITAAGKPASTGEVVVQPLKKLKALIQSLDTKAYFTQADVIELLRTNWLELSWYSHAVHDKLKNGETGYDE